MPVAYLPLQTEKCNRAVHTWKSLYDCVSLLSGCVSLCSLSPSFSPVDKMAQSQQLMQSLLINNRMKITLYKCQGKIRLQFEQNSGKNDYI